MLATRWTAPFIDDSWVFELKWDGVRTLLHWDGDVALRSRAGNDATARYPELESLEFDRPTVLDGEIVAFDDEGRPSFERLQARMNLTGGPDIARAVVRVPISYVVFDVLFHGEELVNQPWSQRRRVLESIELHPPAVRNEVVHGDPSSLWALVEDRNLEGIVAKRRSSVYRSGQRSADWRKITRFRTIRVVVGGYLPGEGGRSGTFGSMLVGLYTPEGLRWAGAVGTGFDDATLRAVRSAFDEMESPTCPFLPDLDLPRHAVWVEPQLVAVVQYKEITAAGRIRAPSFKGFSDDRPESVVWEDEFA